jgi:hypothetical protein
MAERPPGVVVSAFKLPAVTATDVDATGAVGASTPIPGNAFFGIARGLKRRRSAFRMITPNIRCTEGLIML